MSTSTSTERTVAGGVLVAFDGVDGAGKTTQVDALAAALRAAGFSVLVTKEPTDGPWGQKLRDSATTGRLSAEEELEYFVRDRKEHVEKRLVPALERGAFVIIDRYYFSTAAYQGARGADVSAVLARNEAFAPPPDLLVFLDVDPTVGRSRIQKRGDTANLFEDHEGLQAAAEIFRSIKRDFVMRIDGHRTISDVHELVMNGLRDHVLFPRMCQKTNKSSCEPAYCSFRLSDSCDFVRLGF